ncbi:carbohydrate esterase family 4 protein [Halenospora varia]|nr:carbohydrate esterase family 4 protein [Halenospora varia]
MANGPWLITALISMFRYHQRFQSRLHWLVRTLLRTGTRFGPRGGYGRKGKHIKIDDDDEWRDVEAFDKEGCPPPFWGSMRGMVLLSLLSLLVVFVVLAYIIYKPPSFVIGFLQWKYPDVLWRFDLPGKEKIIALTIDDAPSPYTSTILDLLKEYNATATFFTIGSQISDSAAYPALLHRMVKEGHEVGNHGMRDEPAISLPLTELQRQVKEVEGMLPVNESGRKWFRPGSGFFNAGMIEVARKMGYKLVLGSVYPHDAQVKSAGWNSRHVLSMVRPGGVIIMHDRRGYSVEQLRLVLNSLTRKGWRVVNLGEMEKIAESVGKKWKKGG